MINRNSFQDKIKPIEEVAEILAAQKDKGARVALCSGSFEFLHSGHIRKLSVARGGGDTVVVAITADQYVNLGPGRPLFNERLRAETVSALSDVDFVFVNKWPSAAVAIRLLKPDVFVRADTDKDEDPIDEDLWEAEAVAAREVGAQLTTANGASFSASRILNETFGVLAPEVNLFLRDFRRQYSASEVVKAISSLDSLKVLIIGEAILDEYVYGDTLGKSAKEPILALRYLSSEMHAGGSVVIANHLADFCKEIELVTYLGEQNTREEFVRKSLKQNVHPNFVLKAGSPTIVKRRFVEKYLISKLLEIYEINDEPMETGEEAALCEILEERLKQSDLVIAADYGHGLITPRIVDLLCQKARFLAVNTQINAANAGYHTISRFPRADYVCLHEGEVRLDQRDRTSDIRFLVEKLSNRLNARLVMVTQGKHGSLLYHRERGYSACPAFAVKVVDRVGAGDSVLAISSLCAARDLPLEMTGFISNMVGAQAVTILGNRTSIDREQLFLGIQGILR